MAGQAYDTGLALPQRTLLRNAVIAKLGPLLRSNGLYLTAIKPIARMYKGAGDEEGLGLIQSALQGQAPAILVALGKATFEDGGMPRTRKRGLIEVGVYVISLHARDLETGRLATDVVAIDDVTKDPGIETMLEQVQQLLQGQDLGPDTIYDPDIQTEDEVFTGADFTIWEQTYKVMVDRVVTPLVRDAEAPQPVVGIDTTNYQPDAAAPIPNTANPFLITHTELPPP